MVVTRDEIIRVDEQYYVLASSSRVDDRTRVLKQGETMALMDRFGDMAPIGLGELGIFHRGCRHLSQHALSMDDMHERLALLDVAGFPDEGSWYVVYPAGKKLSVIAQTFFEYLKVEAIVIHNELVQQARTALDSGSRRRRS